jgi:hypothetical protein
VTQSKLAIVPDKSRRNHRLPTFFVVGPPRTGTTWLYEVIKASASLPRYTNEVHFFNYNYSKGLDWYLSQFDSTSSKPKGDICSTYFYSADARQRIAALVPNAKIVCTFREPIERIFSLYRTKRAGGIIPWSFEEALTRDSELLESSKYGFHLAQWIALFGRKSILILFNEDMANWPQPYVDEFVDFVGIPSMNIDRACLQKVNSAEGMRSPRSFHCAYVAARMAAWMRLHRLGRFVSAVRGSAIGRFLLEGSHTIPPLDVKTIERLRELLRPEIEQLEQISKRDLSAWKSGPLP